MVQPLIFCHEALFEQLLAYLALFAHERGNGGLDALELHAARQVGLHAVLELGYLAVDAYGHELFQHAFVALARVGDAVGERQHGLFGLAEIGQAEHHVAQTHVLGERLGEVAQRRLVAAQHGLHRQRVTVVGEHLFKEFVVAGEFLDRLFALDVLALRFLFLAAHQYARDGVERERYLARLQKGIRLGVLVRRQRLDQQFLALLAAQFVVEREYLAGVGVGVLVEHRHARPHERRQLCARPRERVDVQVGTQVLYEGIALARFRVVVIYVRLAVAERSERVVERFVVVGQQPLVAYHLAVDRVLAAALARMKEL